MATKAELFRYYKERSGPKRPKKTAAKNASPAVGREGAPHNLSHRAEKNAAYAFEESSGRPSRKSSRKAANRQKNDVQFRMKQRTSEVRPEDRPRPPSR